MMISMLQCWPARRNFMNNISLAVLFCLVAFLVADSALRAAPGDGKKKVLVYTRNYVTNGKGFVHDNIASNVAAIKKIGSENGFDVDASDDPTVFTPENLKQYKAIVFANANNEAFETQAQRDAFRRYIRAGGGFVGIHSASGSEREWPWFWSLLGGKFRRHAKFQAFEVRVADATFPAAKELPATFKWEDEFYYFDNPSPNIHPVLVGDPTKLNDPPRGELEARLGQAAPLAWYQHFEGGRSFYTSLGHKKEFYSDPIMINQMRGGILWAMGEIKEPSAPPAPAKK